jgi:hypothetical protein
MKQSITIPTGNNRAAVIERIGRYLSLLPADKPFQVEVRPYRKTRSDSQNNALWGVAYAAIREETGNDPDDLHEYFCGERFGWVDKQVMGKVKPVPRRTTTKDENGKRSVLTTAEFMDFYAFVQQRAAEVCGVYVPDPNEVVDG